MKESAICEQAINAETTDPYAIGTSTPEGVVRNNCTDDPLELLTRNSLTGVSADLSTMTAVDFTAPIGTPGTKNDLCIRDHFNGTYV
jgi:hypothetical protein